jgi:hypothetical protein
MHRAQCLSLIHYILLLDSDHIVAEDTLSPHLFEETSKLEDKWTFVIYRLCMVVDYHNFIQFLFVFGNSYLFSE